MDTLCTLEYLSSRLVFNFLYYYYYYQTHFLKTWMTIKVFKYSLLWL